MRLRVKLSLYRAGRQACVHGRQGVALTHRQGVECIQSAAAWLVSVVLVKEWCDTYQPVHAVDGLRTKDMMVSSRCSCRSRWCYSSCRHGLWSRASSSELRGYGNRRTLHGRALRVPERRLRLSTPVAPSATHKWHLPCYESAPTGTSSPYPA